MGSQDLGSLQGPLQKALVSTTRLVNQIAAEDLSFQRTSNPAVADELDDASSRFLALTSTLIRSATKDTGAVFPELEDDDDVDVHWSRIVDVLDNLLEKADTCLDEYTGAIKRKAGPVEQPAVPAKKGRYTQLDHSLRRANVLKPQAAFEVKPDNHDTSPWKPILTEKPHAVVPLNESLSTFKDEAQSTQYKHPYEAEIRSLTYPEFTYEQKEPIPYLPFESTTATFVDTYEGVLEMLAELKGATEIAIDTEHHDFRTYSGLLSLMQISTREKDWIVDTLQPWRRKLQVLNEVFADPRIIKVLHGAYMDIVWLQRDCGLYIVGLFDTFEAACALQYAGRSLAYLLKRFVDFDADKKYQLADWRIRPLPEEMFYYARSDTHYLLYIYDNLRNELISFQAQEAPSHTLISQVLDRSKETSLRRHEAAIYDAESGQGSFGWFNMLIRQSAGKLSKEQFSVFRAVHQWRDELARKEDESPLFIMNNATVFDIARRLPPDPKALHSLLDSGSFLAKRNVSHLFDTITEAIVRGANGPSVAEVIRGQSTGTMGIGEVARTVLPRLNNSAKDTVDPNDLVSNLSQLWGHVAVSSRWDPGSTASLPKQNQFEFPWAQFIQSAEVKDNANGIAIQKSTVSKDTASSHSEPTTLVTGDEYPDNEFTLKAGIKRKARETEPGTKLEPDSEPATGTLQASGLNDEMSVDSDDEEIAILDISEDERNFMRYKKEKRAKRRGRQKAEKLAKSQDETGKSTAGSDESDEPFDYSKAKSVLGAEPTSKKAVPGKARFNPYALTAQGPKPARKMHSEMPGKSMTFKR